MRSPQKDPFPLYGQEFKRAPHATYRRLREQGPVHRVEFPSGVLGWLVTGYDAAVETLADARLGKNHDLGNDAWRRRAAIMPEPQHSMLQVHLLHQDPPRHTAMRRAVSEALSPRRVGERHHRIQEIADQVAHALPRTGRADLVSDFAAPFSFAVLSEMIGLPVTLQRRFRREWCKVVQPVGPLSPGRGAYIALLRELQHYIDDVVADKRARPQGDLLSQLVLDNTRGELDDAELTSMVFQLLVAGQEPVTHMICLAVLTLLRTPGQLARLRSGEVDAGRAVDELMRYDGSFELTTWRFFRHDSILRGTPIPAGDSVIVSLAAANRDPARFTDPDVLDLGRSPNPHLAFGHGIHYCPGAALGRTEVHLAVKTLLRELPDLQLDLGAGADGVAEGSDGGLPWVQAVLTRGVDRLPVTYRPLRSARPAAGRNGLAGTSTPNGSANPHGTSALCPHHRGSRPADRAARPTPDLPRGT